MSGNGLLAAAPGLCAAARGSCAADISRLARNPGNRTELAYARAAATRWFTDQGLWLLPWSLRCWDLRCLGQPSDPQHLKQCSNWVHQWHEEVQGERKSGLAGDILEGWQRT